MGLSIISSILALISFVGLGIAYPTNEARLSSRNPSTLVEISSLKATSNYASITRLKTSSNAAQAKGYGNGKLRALEYEGVWTIKINVGGQNVDVALDTGRSNTWVVRKGFKCVNGTLSPLPEENCAFGTLFDGNFPDGAIKDENFNAHGAGGTVYGKVGYESLTITGIQVPHQEIGLVDEADYAGDGITSGSLGLAYAGYTSAYVGNNPFIDNSSITGNQPGDRITYRPVIQTMVQENLIAAPLFSLALERSKNSVYNAPGGYIAFGGLPPVSFDPIFTSTPIEIFQFDGLPPGTAHARSFYTISPDGFVIGSTTGKHVNYPTSTHAIIDSGYPLLQVPTPILNAFIAGISPAPVYNDDYGAWTVSCNASTPFFGVRIAGTVFPIESTDLIGRLTVGDSRNVLSCFVAMYDIGNDAGILVDLGDPFLNNVVAVFDVGSSMMRFAKHVY